MRQHPTQASQVQHRRQAMPFAKVTLHLLDLCLIPCALVVLEGVAFKHKLGVDRLYQQPVQHGCAECCACSSDTRQEGSHSDTGQTWLQNDD